jgi:hypothetical protein
MISQCVQAGLSKDQKDMQQLCRPSAQLLSEELPNSLILHLLSTMGGEQPGWAIQKSAQVNYQRNHCS